MTKIFTASLLLAAISQADVIKCNFTEPFVNTTYSMTQSSLTYKNSEGKTRIEKNVSFQIKSAGVFELVNKNGIILQKIVLNHKGSDGMSDRLYPYAAKDNTKMTLQGHGGCSSNYLE